MTAVLPEDGVLRAIAATGLLAEFNAAGVLAPADVQVATRLRRLGREDDETVLLAAAMAVRALRAGSVCVDLAATDHTVLGDADQLVDVSDLPWPDPTTWAAACARSPLVQTSTTTDDPTARPLHLEGTLLYLERYWRQEEAVRLDLAAREAADLPAVDRARLREGLARHFPEAGPDRQRLAAAVGVLRWVTVLAGGPGTGKTHTVARLLALLRAQDPRARIALAAPTGKAAARMEESVRSQAATLELDLHASTIHRLLGSRPGSSRFRHDRHRRLPVDVLVVDETSMVSLTLMARLLEAVRPDARVILVGDPDQLSPVEAGAVLGDLTRAPGAPEPELEAALTEVGVGADRAELGAPIVHGVVTLRTNHRNRPEIATLAAAIREGDAAATVDLLRAGTAGITLVETSGLEARDPAGLEELRADVVAGSRDVVEYAYAGNTLAALTSLEEHRLLCAHRRGPYGVTRWAAQVERWLTEEGPAPGVEGEWAVGRPLLVTANDYELGLYNGDTGVVVATADGVRAAFARGGEPQLVAPARLGDVATVHAMTVHRAQGSQFTRVSLILPPAESPLLTRELLYTAVTRAKRQVRVVGSVEAVRAAVDRPVRRASGLTRR